MEVTENIRKNSSTWELSLDGGEGTRRLKRESWTGVSLACAFNSGQNQRRNANVRRWEESDEKLQVEFSWDSEICGGFWRMLLVTPPWEKWEQQHTWRERLNLGEADSKYSCYKSVIILKGAPVLEWLLTFIWNTQDPVYCNFYTLTLQPNTSHPHGVSVLEEEAQLCLSWNFFSTRTFLKRDSAGRHQLPILASGDRVFVP